MWGYLAAGNCKKSGHTQYCVEKDASSRSGCIIVNGA